MGQEVKYHINCQPEHGLSDSSVKTGKYLTGPKNMYFFGSET